MKKKKEIKSRNRKIEIFIEIKICKEEWTKLLQRNYQKNSNKIPLQPRTYTH